MKAKRTPQETVSNVSAYRAVTSLIPAAIVVQARPRCYESGERISRRRAVGYIRTANWTSTTMTTPLTILRFRWLDFWVDKYLSISSGTKSRLVWTCNDKYFLSSKPHSDLQAALSTTNGKWSVCTKWRRGTPMILPNSAVSCRCSTIRTFEVLSHPTLDNLTLANNAF